MLGNKIRVLAESMSCWRLGFGSGWHGRDFRALTGGQHLVPPPGPEPQAAAPAAVSPSAFRTSVSSLAMTSLSSFRKLAGVLASPADAFALVATPGTRFLNDVVVHRQIEQIALAQRMVYA